VALALAFLGGTGEEEEEEEEEEARGGGVGCREAPRITSCTAYNSIPAGSTARAAYLPGANVALQEKAGGGGGGGRRGRGGGRRRRPPPLPGSSSEQCGRARRRHLGQAGREVIELGLKRPARWPLGLDRLGDLLAVPGVLQGVRAVLGLGLILVPEHRHVAVLVRVQEDELALHSRLFEEGLGELVLD